MTGAPGAAAADRASFNLSYGATYYRGTAEFYDRSVLVTGELRGLNLTWLKLVRTAVVDAGEGIAEVVG